jgi:hypothetical protein
MRDSPLSCPVPLEQVPINEYETLKASWPFRWVSLTPGGYIRKLLWVWIWGWIITGPITAASFPISTHPLPFLLCGSLAASLLVAFFVARLYLGWFYIRTRLEKALIPYEESGWYDGQTWEKPEQVLSRDRLIVSYQIQPIFQRLRITGLVLLILSAIDSLAWLLIN